METPKTEDFKQWCILELMGHRRLAGLVSEETRFGTSLCRIDIPGPEGKFVTQYYGGSSIYGLTPTTEEVARAFAQNNAPAPVSRWDLRLPEKTTTEPEDADTDDGSGY